jgi:lipopolysaccharide export system protein LptA
MRTSEGTYNLRSGSSQFTQRTTINDGPTRIVGDQIASDDSTGLVQILGNGVLIDTSQGISILANEIFADRRKEAYLATRKPLMIIRQGNDSIYVTADTLFTAKLSDRFIADSSNENLIPDTDSLVQEDTLTSDTVQAVTPVQNDSSIYKDSVRTLSLQRRPSKLTTAPKHVNSFKGDSLNLTIARQPNTVLKNPVIANDSTDRYFEAFRHVRIFSDSVQAVSDSLFYSFRDSIFQLFRDPLVWTNGSQMRGDTIYLHTKNKKAERVRLFENGFLINQLEPGVYNQVKATRMDGWFKAGVIDSVRARGSAESIYYIRNEDSSYTGINQSASDIMDVYFKEGGLNKVVFRSSVKGTMWPASEAKRNKLQLKNFEWLEARRPKTKYELYE